MILLNAGDKIVGGNRDSRTFRAAFEELLKKAPDIEQEMTLAEAGWEGLWTPRVVARLGRCEVDCTLCGHVCPTGAIQPLTVEEKHAVKIGIALIDQSRCIPYAYGRDCGTCVEACPLPDKALRQVDVEIQIHDGKWQRTKIVSQPMVDPDRCTDCGGCVRDCTFKDEPAIRVVSANETRFSFGQPFLNLQQKAAPRPPWPPRPPAKQARTEPGGAARRSPSERTRHWRRSAARCPHLAPFPNERGDPCLRPFA